MEFKTITAKEGYIFKRIHDGFLMDNQIILGYDYSTGKKRLDLPEYYEEILDKNIKEPTTEEMKEALNILGVEI